MTQREKVVEQVSTMIREFGLKSVRMDDVSNALGMSKRTLYEMFGDKEEMLYESLCHMMDESLRRLSQHMQAYDSMLEILLMSVRELCSTQVMNESAHRLSFNLKKFYPAIF